MLTEKLFREELADLEKEYFDFVVKHLGEWEIWAEASARVARGEEVKEEEIPEAFHMELKIMRAILEMEDLGKFDWSDPKIRAIFAELTQRPFYKFFGEMVVRISLKLAELAQAKTLLEVGAGKANLTGIMLKQMRKQDRLIPLVATDSQSVILESIGRLKSEYPQVNLEILLWDILKTPSSRLLAKLTSPTLLYERFTLTYANFKALENFAEVADILVLGDFFNHTGKLYAYDEVFQKIGSKTVFYKDVKPLLDDRFPNQYVFDQRALDTLKLPNMTLLIAWK